jgi:hypothetical protein
LSHLRTHAAAMYLYVRYWQALFGRGVIPD